MYPVFSMVWEAGVYSRQEVAELSLGNGLVSDDWVGPDPSSLVTPVRCLIQGSKLSQGVRILGVQEEVTCVSWKKDCVLRLPMEGTRNTSLASCAG